MSKDNVLMEGKIVKVLPNTKFKVILENNMEITAYLSGKLRKNFISIIEGDEVKVEMSPYDLTKGRISYRKK